MSAIETVDFTDIAAELFLEWLALDEDERDDLPHNAASEAEPIPFTVSDDYTVKLGHWDFGVWGCASENLPALADVIVRTAAMVEYSEDDAAEFNRALVVGTIDRLTEVFQRMKRELKGGF